MTTEQREMANFKHVNRKVLYEEVQSFVLPKITMISLRKTDELCVFICLLEHFTYIFQIVDLRVLFLVLDSKPITGSIFFLFFLVKTLVLVIRTSFAAFLLSSIPRKYTIGVPQDMIST